MITIRFNEIELLVSKQLSETELKMLRQYAAGLDSIRELLGKMYGKYGDQVTLGDMTQYNRLASIEVQLLQEIKKLSSVSLKATSGILAQTFENSYYGTGFVLENETGLKLGFSKLNPDIIKKSVENPLSKVKWQSRLKINHDYYAQRTTNILTDGLIKGHGFAKTAANMKEQLDSLANNTLRIVRTENHRVSNEARHLGIDRGKKAGERLGITVFKVWDANNSKDPRKNHNDMDGQKADADGLFTMVTADGATIKVDKPGNTGLAGEDINCNCFLRTEIAGLSGNPRGEYNSFDDWYTKRINK